MGKIRNKILRSILLSSVLSFLGTNAEAAPSNVTLDNDNNDDQDLINSLKSKVQIDCITSLSSFPFITQIKFKWRISFFRKFISFFKQ